MAKPGDIPKSLDFRYCPHQRHGRGSQRLVYPEQASLFNWRVPALLNKKITFLSKLTSQHSILSDAQSFWRFSQVSGDPAGTALRQNKKTLWCYFSVLESESMQ